ncbi:MAG: hypothetical protein LIO79_02105 [Rikenellaceae bacterium]|nr:hypothetical protein [Rikenellaceae bacterium]
MEKSFTTDWLRLQMVIRSAGMTVNSFAHHIGLKRLENLYQIKKGNHGISKTLARQIHAHYPRFPVTWLVMGVELPDEEEIVADDEKIISIPLFKVFPPFCGLDNNPDDHVIHLGESIAQRAELATVNTDESLSPKIPVGAIVLLRPFDGKIIFGKFYLIVTESYSLIRKVRSTYNPDEYRLTTLDPENFDDIILPSERIKKIYIVERVIVDV